MVEREPLPPPLLVVQEFAKERSVAVKNTERMDAFLQEIGFRERVKDRSTGEEQDAGEEPDQLLHKAQSSKNGNLGQCSGVRAFLGLSND